MARGALPSDQARTWLADRGHEGAPAGSRTIAELYATIEGRAAPLGRPPVGFGPDR